MSSLIGGQAVLEGVMMRGPSNWAVAVRKPDGAIAQVSKRVESAMVRHRVFRLPIIRGVIALGESLTIGFKALAISANYAAAEEGEVVEELAALDGEPQFEIGKAQLFIAFAVAIAFVVIVFKVGPALLVDKLVPVHNGTWFVIIE